jgi:hypothetical protein
MSFDPSNLTITNPVFHAYVLAASLMLLKLMLQPWMTVQRMMKVHAGFRSPEDARQTPLNPDPISTTSKASRDSLQPASSSYWPDHPFFSAKS